MKRLFDVRNRIGARLTLGFATTALLITIIALFSAERMGSLDAAIGEALDLRMPRLAAMNEVLADIDELGQALRSALLVEGTDAAVTQTRLVQENRGRVGDRLEQLTTMFPEGDQAGDAVRTLVEEKS